MDVLLEEIITFRGRALRPGMTEIIILQRPQEDVLRPRSVDATILHHRLVITGQQMLHLLTFILTAREISVAMTMNATTIVNAPYRRRIIGKMIAALIVSKAIEVPLICPPLTITYKERLSRNVQSFTTALTRTIAIRMILGILIMTPLPCYLMRLQPRNGGNLYLLFKPLIWVIILCSLLNKLTISLGMVANECPVTTAPIPCHPNLEATLCLMMND